MCNCKSCKHAVYDELWGEYKCKHRESWIYILLDEYECPDYDKGEPSKTKDEHNGGERL